MFLPYGLSSVVGQFTSLPSVYFRMDFVADMFKVFLFVQIAVHHKEQGERREVGSVRRLYIGAMFPQPATATAVKADAMSVVGGSTSSTMGCPACRMKVSRMRRPNPPPRREGQVARCSP